MTNRRLHENNQKERVFGSRRISPRLERHYVVILGTQPAVELFGTYETLYLVAY
jgi:hypothetical protein